MSTDGSLTRLWGDGERTFRLRIGELRELEDKRDSGSSEIFQRFVRGTWRVNDVTEVLRLGLIGGGTPPHLALGLVAKYVTPMALIENSIVARDVMIAAIFPDLFDQVGKAVAETGAASSQDEPDSRPTSAPAPQWDGASTTSTEPRSGNSPPLAKDGNGLTDLTTSLRPQ